MTSLFRCAVLVGLSALAQSQTYGIDTYWGPCPVPADPCAGEWGCGCNWDPSVPTIDDNVFINSPPTCWVRTSQTIGSLTLGTEDAELRVHSPGVASNIFTSATSITNAGTIGLSSAGTGGAAWIVIESGALTNLSTGVIEAAAGVGERRITGNVTNDGAITIASGKTLRLDGDLASGAEANLSMQLTRIIQADERQHQFAASMRGRNRLLKTAFAPRKTVCFPAKRNKACPTTCEEQTYKARAEQLTGTMNNAG